MVTAVRDLWLLVLLLLAPARRVDVVGLLLPSHLTCDGLESWAGFPLPPVTECGIWCRFALYVDTVCRRCLDAGVDCGCDDGLGNPAVGEIMRYIERTVATVQHAAPNGFLPTLTVQPGTVFVAPFPVTQEANNCASGYACFPSPQNPRPPNAPSLGSIQARPPNRHCSTPMYVAPSAPAAVLSGSAVSAAVLSGSAVAAATTTA